MVPPYWLLLSLTILSTGIGSMKIIKKDPIRYGLIALLSVKMSITLCWFFLFCEFYRFVLPLPSIFVAVATSFTFLALFTVAFKPENRLFPFFFTVTTFVFAIEVFLKDVFSFIVYRNNWDGWDSYTLIWIYVRVFAFLGEWLVARKFRNPINTDKRSYWYFFFFAVCLWISGYIYLVWF